MMMKRIAVVGGGAGGFFSAINCAELHPDYEIEILEGTSKVLSKVLISGGGRCNLTNFALSTNDLQAKYPRGGKELLGPYSRYAVKETMAWFESRGVKLKVEADNRVFPITDSSKTIADCLIHASKNSGVKIRLNERVRKIDYDESLGKFNLHTIKASEKYDAVVLASGGSDGSFSLASQLGHKIIPAVPSLFTFEIVNPLLEGLQGVSFQSAEASLKFGKKNFKNIGPLLITHWGLSGPSVIVLSSICARELHNCNYKTLLKVNFLGEKSCDQALHEIKEFRSANLKKKVTNAKPFDIPNSFWERILNLSGGDFLSVWQDMSSKKIQEVLNFLLNSSFQISGKGKFKEEFVTAGGVSLKEVDFRTMESKKCKGLFFAGEVLDVDGVTGGYNFQSAWTTGWIASQNI